MSRARLPFRHLASMNHFSRRTGAVNSISTRTPCPMPYTDFTLEAAESRFGLTAVPGELFPGLRPVPVPAWLHDLLALGRSVAALVSEKARSEFLVTPLLLACRDLVPGALSIYSGQRLDVDPEQGLTGECDYILALTRVSELTR